jgi:prolyl 4-hydroxylase
MTTLSNIKLLEDFLSNEQCEKIIECYKDKVKRSTVVSTKGDYTSDTRTSSTAFTSKDDELIKIIKEKAAKYVNLPETHIEGIQFLKYEKGQYYKYHNDYFSNPRGNSQRVHTILLYLNDLEFEDGGETTFKYYKLKIFPKKGMAVWFRNSNDDGTIIEQKSMHSGDPLLTDKEKYALNIWIRNKPV